MVVVLSRRLQCRWKIFEERPRVVVRATARHPPFCRGQARAAPCFGDAAPLSGQCKAKSLTAAKSTDAALVRINALRAVRACMCCCPGPELEPVAQCIPGAEGGLLLWRAAGIERRRRDSEASSPSSQRALDRAEGPL